MTIEKLKANCPEGYTVAIPGRTIDMLGATELWIIYSNHTEPHVMRIPQDYVDYGNGKAAARVPKEWGHPLYYKLVL